MSHGSHHFVLYSEAYPVEKLHILPFQDLMQKAHHFCSTPLFSNLKEKYKMFIALQLANSHNFAVNVDHDLRGQALLVVNSTLLEQGKKFSNADCLPPQRLPMS